MKELDKKTMKNRQDDRNKCCTVFGIKLGNHKIKARGRMLPRPRGFIAWPRQEESMDYSTWKGT